MSTAIAATPRRPPWPWVAPAAVLAGLWLASFHPPAAALWQPLSVLTAAAAAQLLAVLGLPVVRELTVLTHAGGFACEIDAACTALLPATLLAAVVLAWRRSWSARLAGAAGGVVLLVLLNQLRLASLVWSGVYAPAWFDALHLGLWPPLLVLAAGGYAWMWSRAARRRA